MLDSKTSINKTFRIMVKIEMEVGNNKKFIMKINWAKMKYCRYKVKIKLVWKNKNQEISILVKVKLYKI